MHAFAVPRQEYLLPCSETCIEHLVCAQKESYLRHQRTGGLGRGLSTWGPESPWQSQPAPPPVTTPWLNRWLGPKSGQTDKGEEDRAGRAGRAGNRAALRTSTETERAWALGQLAAFHRPSPPPPTPPRDLHPEKARPWAGSRPRSLAEHFTGPAAQSEFSCRVMADKRQYRHSQGNTGS